MTKSRPERDAHRTKVIIRNQTRHHRHSGTVRVTEHSISTDRKKKKKKHGHRKNASQHSTISPPHPPLQAAPEQENNGDTISKAVSDRTAVKNINDGGVAEVRK